MWWVFGGLSYRTSLKFVRRSWKSKKWICKVLINSFKMLLQHFSVILLWNKFASIYPICRILLQFYWFLIWIYLFFDFAQNLSIILPPNLCIESPICSQFTRQFAVFTSFLQKITYFNWKFKHCSEIAKIQAFNMQMRDHVCLAWGAFSWLQGCKYILL